MPIERVELARTLIYPPGDMGAIMPISEETAPAILYQAAQGHFEVIEAVLDQNHGLQVPENCTVQQFLATAAVAAAKTHAELRGIRLDREPTGVTIIVNPAMYFP